MEENTLDTLKEGDEIEWEDCQDEVRKGTIIDILGEWGVYVDYWRSNGICTTEVHITDIISIK